MAHDFSDVCPSCGYQCMTVEQCYKAQQQKATKDQPVELDEMKPCPFCGGEAKMYQTKIDNIDCYKAVCGNPWCLVKPSTQSVTKSNTSSIWNTRPMRESGHLVSCDINTSLTAGCSCGRWRDEHDRPLRFKGVLRDKTDIEGQS